MGQSHGNQVEYEENGKHHGDTVVYKDEDLLHAVGREPNYITSINVWHDDFIYGIEVFYDGVSSGVRRGNNPVPGNLSTIHLAPGENITKIKGKHGDIMDHLEFHTSHGHKHKFGSSKGGHGFNQDPKDGDVLKGLVTGWGGHLHFIGSYWAKPYVPYILSHVAGKVHGDTVPFNDFQTILLGKQVVEIRELRVFHDWQMVYGVQCVYFVDG